MFFGDCKKNGDGHVNRRAGGGRREQGARAVSDRVRFFYPGRVHVLTAVSPRGTLVETAKGKRKAAGEKRSARAAAAHRQRSECPAICRAVQGSAVPCSAVPSEPCSTVPRRQRSAVHSAVQCSAVRCSAVLCRQCSVGAGITSCRKETEQGTLRADQIWVSEIHFCRD